MCFLVLVGKESLLATCFRLFELIISNRVLISQYEYCIALGPNPLQIKRKSFFSYPLCSPLSFILDLSIITFFFSKEFRSVSLNSKFFVPIKKCESKIMCTDKASQLTNFLSLSLSLSLSLTLPLFQRTRKFMVSEMHGIDTMYIILHVISYGFTPPPFSVHGYFFWHQ